ncbi:MAG: acetyl-CoA carboxylase biotin carboxyl carrier protein subunit, partial [Clostridia bacterium]|nr:acetyl-CoA carboxylase biotin carboxyl carrier protein subunit [Clostridia bacterium]
MRNFKITVNGKTYDVAVEEVGAGAVASAPVAVSTAPAAVAPTPAPAAASAPANGEKVLSPFPGLIKSLLVANGATVKKDQPILV